jgi:hypothetical protein
MLHIRWEALLGARLRADEIEVRYALPVPYGFSRMHGHTHAYKRIHTHTHTHAYTRVHTHTHAYTHAYTHTNTHTSTHTPLTLTHLFPKYTHTHSLLSQVLLLMWLFQNPKPAMLASVEKVRYYRTVCVCVCVYVCVCVC